MTELPIRGLPAQPRNVEEARALYELVKRDWQGIHEQLTNEARREAMPALAYFEWQARARKAQHVKQVQMEALKAWIKERLDPAPPATPHTTAEEKRLARQAAHAERIAGYIALTGVKDPHDPWELLRLARSVFINCIDDGMEFSEEEQALFDVIREAFNAEEGHGALAAD